MRIKTNDTVVVLSGKDKGKQGRVTAVDLEARKVTVDGVNEVKRHVRRSQRNMQGGRLSKMMPVPVAKVMLVCPKCQNAVRVGYKVEETIDESGKKNRVKSRVCKKCDAVLPDPPYSKKRN
ncbi:MAG: 50S ribosomal protein L24 [Thermoguttaceae bacterium]|jgi:large subunit ribosomal protein L24